MTQKLTLRYDNETHRVTQTYWGSVPDWDEKDGTTITETQANTEVRQQQFEDVLSAVSESEYNADIETPVPHLTYNPDTDSIEARVEFQSVSDFDSPQA